MIIWQISANHNGFGKQQTRKFQKFIDNFLWLHAYKLHIDYSCKTLFTSLLGFIFLRCQGSNYRNRGVLKLIKVRNVIHLFNKIVKIFVVEIVILFQDFTPFSFLYWTENALFPQGNSISNCNCRLKLPTIISHSDEKPQRLLSRPQQQQPQCKPECEKSQSYL